MYDNLSWMEAAARAWRIPGPHPAHHRNMQDTVRAIFPELGRALDRSSLYHSRQHVEEEVLPLTKHLDCQDCIDILHVAASSGE